MISRIQLNLINDKTPECLQMIMCAVYNTTKTLLLSVKYIQTHLYNCNFFIVKLGFLFIFHH